MTTSSSRGLVRWLVGISLLGCSLQTTLLRRDLTSYELARCNDGSPAAYFYQQDVRYTGQDVLVYLPDGGDCGTIEECREKCREGSSSSESCTAPTQQVLERREGIWSENPAINPFSNHFKVILHYCSNDNYAGTRGASKSSGNFNFHGKHVLTAMLDDMSVRFGLDKAASLILVGTGSGARGVGYNCDYVASLLPGVRVRCLADSPDMVPWWVKTDSCGIRDYEKEEGEKILWGRQDDESCVEEHKSEVNSSELAHRCGVWSRYWTHIDTPFFILGSQFDPSSFSSNPCVPDISDPEYEEFELAWRRGVAALYESVLAGRGDRSWFVPDCRAHGYLDGALADTRLAQLTVPLLEDTNQTMSLSESLTHWLKDSSPLHAMDSVAAGNSVCPGPAPLCRTNAGCSAGRSYADYPSVRRRLLPPSSIFPSGYDRRCCVDPWLRGGTGYGSGGRTGYGSGGRTGYGLGGDTGYGLGGGVGLGGVGHGLGGVGHGLGGVGHGLGGVGHGLGGVDTVLGGGSHGYGVGTGTALGGRGADAGRRNRLWKRLLYLQYLKQLYAKQKTDYAREYYGYDGLDSVYSGGRIPALPDLGLGGDTSVRDHGRTPLLGDNAHRPTLGGRAGGRDRFPDLTDLLGEDYYDYYDDYGTGSGLLARIRTAIRLRKEKKEGKEAGSTTAEEEETEEFDFEDFGPLTEDAEVVPKRL